jgi:hypothetical protein
MDIKWFLFQEQLFQVMPVARSHITITAYDVSLGTRLSSHDIPAPWIAEDSRYYLLSFLDSFSKSKMCKDSVLPT